MKMVISKWTVDPSERGNNLRAETLTASLPFMMKRATFAHGRYFYCVSF